MRAAGTDAIGALRWGLRRYRVLFVLCLLLGGAAAPYLALARATAAEASALVIAEQLDMDLAAVPRYGEAVFDNGQVAQAVAAEFGDLGDYEDIVPSRVSVVAEQDSIVFEVVGRDADPEVAADLANTAAAAFIDALNAAGAGVGTFALQSPAEPPIDPGNELGTIFAIPVGILAGAVLGLAAISMLLVVRRPVIDGADAEEATGVPALGTVTLPRTRRDAFVDPTDVAGLVPACRRLLGLPTRIVVMVSRPGDEAVRRQLSVALTTVLGRVRDVQFVGPDDLRSAVAQQVPAPGSAGPGSITLVDSGDPLDLIQPPQHTVTVLVVRAGIPSEVLRAAAAEHLGGSAEARILLVQTGQRWRGTQGRPRIVEHEDDHDHVALADRA